MSPATWIHTGTTIFSFPLESPKESLTTEEVGTIDQLQAGDYL